MGDSQIQNNPSQHCNQSRRAQSAWRIANLSTEDLIFRILHSAINISLSPTHKVSFLIMVTVTSGNNLNKYQCGPQVKLHKSQRICLTKPTSRYRILRNYNLQSNYCSAGTKQKCRPRRTLGAELR